MLFRADGVALTDVSSLYVLRHKPAVLVKTAGCSVGLCTLNVSTFVTVATNQTQLVYSFRNTNWKSLRFRTNMQLNKFMHRNT